MGITVVGIIVGVVVAGAWSLMIDFMAKDRSVALWVINLIVGALGAVSANQLLVYGPMVFGISIVPAIVGSLVLAMVATYAFKKLAKSYRVSNN